jgi:hypothetical protein
MPVTTTTIKSERTTLERYRRMTSLHDEWRQGDDRKRSATETVAVPTAAAIARRRDYRECLGGRGYGHYVEAA